MNTATSNEAAFAGGFLGGMFTVFLIFSIIWAILLIVAGWKIFEKAGEKGWKILIPVYNVYILFKLIGMKTWFWTLLIASIVAGLLAGVAGFDTQNIQNNSFTGMNLFAGIVYILVVAFSFVVAVCSYVRLSRVFGHGILFAIGLIFLSGIFMMILGFGRSKYNRKLAAAWER